MQQQMIRGYWPSRCILTALELDIFTAVGDGANAEQIGTNIHANVRGVGMLLNALVALGLLSKSGDVYSNTFESARFFVQSSKDKQFGNGVNSVVDEVMEAGGSVRASYSIPEWLR
jgi:Dimerisation domain